jgi:hypothetical protein
VGEEDGPDQEEVVNDGEIVGEGEIVGGEEGLDQEEEKKNEINIVSRNIKNLQNKTPDLVLKFIIRELYQEKYKLENRIEKLERNAKKMGNIFENAREFMDACLHCEKVSRTLDCDTDLHLYCESCDKEAGDICGECISSKKMGKTVGTGGYCKWWCPACCGN